jgi:hypothetical protein
LDITTTALGVNMTGSSTQGIKTVRHPVSDLATAKAVYAALLGVPPQTAHRLSNAFSFNVPSVRGIAQISIEKAALGDGDRLE